MSLAAATAKIRGVACHYARADTGGVYCGTTVTERTLFTWRPEEVTCKRCLKRHAEQKIDAIKAECPQCNEARGI